MASFKYYSLFFNLLLLLLQHLIWPSHGHPSFPIYKRDLGWEDINLEEGTERNLVEQNIGEKLHPLPSDRWFDDNGELLPGMPRSGTVNWRRRLTNPLVTWLKIFTEKKVYVHFFVVYPLNTESVFWGGFKKDTLLKIHSQGDGAKDEYDRLMSEILPDLSELSDKYGHAGRKPTGVILMTSVLESPENQKLGEWIKEDVERTLGGRDKVQSWEFVGPRISSLDSGETNKEGEESDSDSDSEYDDCIFTDDEGDEDDISPIDDGTEGVDGIGPLGPVHVMNGAFSNLFFRRANAALNIWEWTFYSTLVHGGERPAIRPTSFVFEDNSQFE